MQVKAPSGRSSSQHEASPEVQVAQQQVEVEASREVQLLDGIPELQVLLGPIGEGQFGGRSGLFHSNCT